MSETGELVGTFDLLRWAPEGAAQSRAKALARMREIVNEREPENIIYLNTHPGLSAEYAMSSAIMHSKNPEVKADLTRVSVKQHLEEGNRWGAVHMLAYAEAAELPLPEYSEEWVAGQFDAAMSEGNPRIAWSIAGTMLRNVDKIVKREPQAEGASTPPQAWVEREKKAFAQHVEEVLAREERLGDMRDEWELRSLFDEMRFRQDGGFNSDNPSELSRRIAEKIIQLDLATKGREWIALIDAAEAKMPDEYIAQLRRQVSPTVADRARQWASKVGDRFSRLIKK